jgi:carbonic anhydrase
VSAIDRVVSNSRHVHLGSSQAPAEPRLKLVVVTCMDARIDVHKLLGLLPGDAHVIRNAGGIVSEDVIRSVALSQGNLGTEEVMVVHHTQCAAGFEDEQQAVRDDVARLRDAPELSRREQVRGFIYDVQRERLDEVAV